MIVYIFIAFNNMSDLLIHIFEVFIHCINIAIILLIDWLLLMPTLAIFQLYRGIAVIF
jgi:hypothetical protein